MGLSDLNSILSLKYSLPVLIIIAILARLFNDYYLLVIVISSFILTPVLIYVLFSERKYTWLITTKYQYILNY